MGGSRTRISPCVSQRRKTIFQFPSTKPAAAENFDVMLPMLVVDDMVQQSDSEDSCELQQKQHQARHVGFANVEVREYAVTVGDHPCCTMGCPLTLDWEYKTARVTSLDTYETQRSPRRTREELRTSASDRMRILSEEGGLSDGELRRATRKLFRARSCIARLSEKMSESFFRYEESERQHPAAAGLDVADPAMGHASPCA